MPIEEHPEISWVAGRAIFWSPFQCHSFFLSSQPNIIFLCPLGIFVLILSSLPYLHPADGCKMEDQDISIPKMEFILIPSENI